MRCVSEIACTLGFDVSEPAELVLQIAVPSPLTESLSVEAVERDGGWKRIADLPALFPALAGS